MDNQAEKPVFHTLSAQKSSLSFVVLCIMVMVIGGFLGYALVNYTTAQSASSQSLTSSSGAKVQTGAVYGSDDMNTFKDSAEGVVQTGGINGEGQYHLLRPGGDSQNVYMTSSLVDLSLFVGKKVKVWGQTQKAQTAGWLMDVGRVEVE